MQINKVSDVTGVITTEDTIEGRMVLLTSNPGYTQDIGPVNDLTGRLQDVPGVKLPDTLEEAARATYVITWTVEQRQPPIIGWPAYGYALRQGFDQAGNCPVTGRTIYITWPGYQDSMTIPSGYYALGYNCCGGEYTVPSGHYVYSANVRVPGTRLRACDAATDGAEDAGRLAEVVSGSTPVAEVSRFNATTFELTFRGIC